jgi:hypothetical protein
VDLLFKGVHALLFIKVVVGFVGAGRFHSVCYLQVSIFFSKLSGFSKE